MSPEAYDKYRKHLDNRIEDNLRSLLAAAIDSTDPIVRALAHRFQALKDTKAELQRLARDEES